MRRVGDRRGSQKAGALMGKMGTRPMHLARTVLLMVTGVEWVAPVAAQLEEVAISIDGVT